MKKKGETISAQCISGIHGLTTKPTSHVSENADGAGVDEKFKSTIGAMGLGSTDGYGENMGLLSPETWAEVFTPYRGLVAKYVPHPGNNPGDRLIDEATFQLFNYYKIIQGDNPDVIFCAGGGNLGNKWWPECYEARGKALIEANGKPIVVLPQTFTGGIEHTGYTTIWVREQTSLKTVVGSKLAPDMSLGYTILNEISEPVYKNGVFLRSDYNGMVPNDIGDPVTMAVTATEYISLASKYGEIITNRLHFAVAGLLVGRKVTLLAGTYWKNRAVWEQSLCELKCEWLGPNGKNHQLGLFL